MRPRTPLAILSLLVLASAPAAAQLHLMREATFSAATPAELRTAARVRADLDAFRERQEAWRSAHDGYALDVAQLAFEPASGATLVLLMSGPDGWKVEATHPALRGTEVVHVMRGTGAPGAAHAMAGMECMHGGARGGMTGGMRHGPPADSTASPPRGGAGCCAGMGAPKAGPPAGAAGAAHQHQ